MSADGKSPEPGSASPRPPEETSPVPPRDDTASAAPQASTTPTGTGPERPLESLPRRPRAHRKIRPSPVHLRPSDRIGWLLVLMGTGVVLALGMIILVREYWSEGERGAVGFVPGEEVDRTREDNFTIVAPQNWVIQNARRLNASVLISGPKERVSPIILVSTEIQPGDVKMYVDQLKAREEKSDPSLRWLEESRTKIGNREAIRLDYEYDEDPGPNAVKIRATLYIVNVEMIKYFRITICCPANRWNKYKAKLEGCANTFRYSLPPAPSVMQTRDPRTMPPEKD